MKTKSIITFLAILLLAACEPDDSITKDLQAQITKLEGTITTLQGTINTLNSSNSSLSTELETAQDAVDSATAALQTSGTDIGELQTKLEFLEQGLSGIDYSATVPLDATGTIADMSAAQAKQTIYGKWDIGGASSSKSSSRNGCSFQFIEFTKTKYLMSILDADSEPNVIFGTYVLSETTDGKVTSVDLMYDAGDSEIKVAVLTNIVVTDNAAGDELSATFDVVLTLPAALQSCESSLPGSVASIKDEPVEEAKTATAVSNHAKLIGEWDLVSYTSSERPSVSLFDDVCNVYSTTLDEDGNSVDEITVEEGCVIPSSVIVNFSNFGTYSLTFLDINGSVLEVEISGWKWKDSDQKTLLFGEADSMDTADDLYTLDVLTLEAFTMSNSYLNDYNVKVIDVITMRRR